MVSAVVTYAGYSILSVFQFFVCIWQYLQEKKDQTKTYLKGCVLDGMVVTYGFYDKEQKCYMLLYDYDRFWMLVWLYIKCIILKYRVMMVPVHVNSPKDLASERFIFVGFFMKERKQYHAILDADGASHYNCELDTTQKTKDFVYCIADDKYDLTHLFEKYKYSLSLNTTILCEDMILIMLSLSNKMILLRDDKLEELKLMYENDLIELVFKGTDRLIINPSK